MITGRLVIEFKVRSALCFKDIDAIQNRIKRPSLDVVEED
jgi:hypothetical protein